MLSAFAARPIVELKQRDKSKIESVLALGDRVFVGLNTGALRIYTINDTSEEPGENGTPADGDNSHTQPRNSSTRKSFATLRREIEKFSRRPVQQLAIFQDASVLISLADGYVFFHDLETYVLSQRLDATKGATAFATTRNIVHDPETGIASIISRLAVAVRRKLLVWTWQDMELASEAQEVAVPATIKCLTWASGTGVLVGMDPGFSIVNVETGVTTDINRPSEPNEEGTAAMVRFGAVNVSGINYIGMSSWVPTPMATKLSKNDLLLAKDVNTLFINAEGQPLDRRQVPWVTGPDSMGYSYPYLLSLHSPIKGQLDIRNPDSLSLLQSISLPNASILHVPHPNISLAHAGKGFLVASERCIWQMDAVSYGSQIDELCRRGQFNEALSILGLIEDTLMLDKYHRIRQVKIQKAFWLFSKSQFREALDLFAEAETHPAVVVSLYPRSIAGDLSSYLSTHKDHLGPSSETGQRKITDSLRSAPHSRNQSLEVRNGEELEGKKLLTAVQALPSFLVHTRRELIKYIDYNGQLRPEYRHWQKDNDISHLDTDKLPPFANLVDHDKIDGPIDWQNLLHEVATLVDTVLFRAYMLVTPTLAGPLFRLDNFCSADVVEEKLYEHGRYNELIEFLRGKKLHREALKLLEKFGKEETKDENLEDFQGPFKTIEYLQQLPFEEVDLILEYATWPMQENPDAAMEIFTADSNNSKYLPRQRVLDFLRSARPEKEVVYLEHIINEFHDTTSKYHNQLAKIYLTELRKASVGDEVSNTWQEKLEALLKSSKDYSQKDILKQLPSDDPRFFESRATVLCKMSRHKEALEIYVYQIQDYSRAEDYCNQVYLEATARLGAQADPDESASIYTTLLSLYLKPPSPHLAQLEPALQILSAHGSRLPALQTLEALPLSLPINDLQEYFKTRMRTATAIAREEAVVASMRKVDKLSVEADLLLGTDWESTRPKTDTAAGKSRRVILSDNRLCSICNKRFGRAAARLWPDGRVVHYGCADRVR